MWLAKSFLRKSTAQKNRIDATKVAYDLFQVFITQPTKYTKIDALNSYKFYADKLIEKQRWDLRFSEPKSDFALKFNMGVTPEGTSKFMLLSASYNLRLRGYPNGKIKSMVLKGSNRFGSCFVFKF